MIKIVIVAERDYIRNLDVYTIAIPHGDAAVLDLCPLDRAVLSTPIKSQADILQNLELIVRRIEEKGGKT